MPRRPPDQQGLTVPIVFLVAVAAMMAVLAPTASAAAFVPISGSGSTWIPYALTDGGVVDPAPTRAFGYLPIVAGGTAFMYNLKIGNQRVTNLRLSGETVTRIFTQEITKWDDPAIQADNLGLALPGRAIVPVVHSDGADVTAALREILSVRWS